MNFFRFSHANVCALLVVIYFVVTVASKTWHPVGLSTIIRTGKRYEGSDSTPTIIHLASKKWHPLGLSSMTRIGKRYQETDSDPSYLHINNPENWQLSYDDQEDNMGLDAYYDNLL